MMRLVRTAGLWLFVAAFVLRAGWVGYRWQAAGPKLEYPDEELHWQLASHVAHDGTMVSDDGRYTARMPVYPLFLAVFARWGDHGILAARLTQAALGGAAVVLAARLARRAFGDRAGLIAGILICCDPFAIFFSNLLLTESVFTVLLMAVVSSALRLAAEPRSWAHAFCLAIGGTAAVMTRPAALALLPVVWALVLLFASGRRGLLARLVLCPLALIIGLLPWGLRNRATIGSFAWLSTNGGVTLYDAQGPQADGSSSQAFLRQIPEIEQQGEAERDRTLQRLAVAQMRADPLHVACLAGVKFRRTWSPLPNVAEYHAGSAGYAGAAYTVVLIAGALVAVLRAARPPHEKMRTAVYVLILATVVYFTLLHCVYIGSVRYRVPLMPLLAVAAAGVVQRTLTRSGLRPNSVRQI